MIGDLNLNFKTSLNWGSNKLHKMNYILGYSLLSSMQSEDKRKEERRRYSARKMNKINFFFSLQAEMSRH